MNHSVQSSYYTDKLTVLRALFNSPVELENGYLRVGSQRYPIVDDVIILLHPSQYTTELRSRLPMAEPTDGAIMYAAEIQSTFGKEWTTFSNPLAEYEQEFARYFDLIDLAGLRNATVMDLGCGTGRWSRFVAPLCTSLHLLDFSDAIFVARANLAQHSNCCFFMADISALPFKPQCVDFAFSLGVLHHLPTPALEAVRQLGGLAPSLLIYLYYGLDNRPVFQRTLLGAVTKLRTRLSGIQDERARVAIATVLAAVIYMPLVGLGKLLSGVGLGRHVPLYEGYRSASFQLMKQDAYDRFFTAIEQRFTRAQIYELKDSFREVIISDGIPHWHFLCRQ